MGGTRPRDAGRGCARVTAERREHGQGTAELAMMLPLILVLIVGVIEMSAAFNTYVSVVSAARDGARLGSKGAATTPQIQALVVKDLGRLRNPTPSSNVTVTYPVVSGVNAVKVRACYDHTTLLQVPLILPNSYHVCSETTMPKLN